MTVSTISSMITPTDLGTCVTRADGTVVGYVRRSAATAIATTTRSGSPAGHAGVWNLGGCPSMPPRMAPKTAPRATTPLQAA